MGKDAPVRHEQATVIVSTSFDAACDGRSTRVLSGYTPGYLWQLQLDEPSQLKVKGSQMLERRDDRAKDDTGHRR